MVKWYVYTVYLNTLFLYVVYKIGDQILDVNGQSFLDTSHPEAVRLLKMSKHLVFTIKDVGKLPYAR